MLHDTLHSLIAACAGREDAVECLAVDNGSTDDTLSVVNDFSGSAPFSVRSVHEPCPGLHVGRNLGAVSARGDVLAYLDDDVLVQPGWADALIARFAADPAIMIAGGPCLPHWEEPPPDWIQSLKTPLPDAGWVMAELSLIYMGDTPLPVPGNYIFGCNFAIRKRFVLDSGGFHPDGMPPRLLHFRGDGETEMGMKVDAHPKYTAFYDPKIIVLHRVPATRMTKEYIAGIVRRNSIGAAYSAYRASGGGAGALRPLPRLMRTLLAAVKKRVRQRVKRMIRRSAPNASPINRPALDAFAAWQTCRHYVRICLSPVLRKWATQPSYLPGTPCPYDQKDAV